MFVKCELDTLKKLLVESSVVYLNKEQILFKEGSQDNFVYFVLFGWLIFTVSNHSNRYNDQQQNLIT